VNLTVEERFTLARIVDLGCDAAQPSYRDDAEQLRTIARSILVLARLRDTMDSGAHEPAPGDGDYLRERRADVAECLREETALDNEDRDPVVEDTLLAELALLDRLLAAGTVVA